MLPYFEEIKSFNESSASNNLTGFNIFTHDHTRCVALSQMIIIFHAICFPVHDEISNPYILRFIPIVMLYYLESPNMSKKRKKKNLTFKKSF